MKDTPSEEQEALRLSAAKRALVEAEARRRNIVAFEESMPAERGGRGGREPVRYGDWEIKGIAADF